MNNLMSIAKKNYTNYKIKRERGILKSREYTSSFEKAKTLPHIYSCIVSIDGYFENLNQIAETHKRSHTFGTALHQVMELDALRRFQTGATLPTPEETSEKYYTELQNLIKNEYLSKTREFLEEFRNIEETDSIDDAIKFLTKASFICSIILDIKTKFLLYSIQQYVSKHDPQTGTMIDVTPRALAVISMPFKITAENIVSIAEVTRVNIQNWSKEQLEWKSSLLKIRTERIAQRNNLLTIVTAVSLSALFYTVPDFIKQKQIEAEIERTTMENTSLKRENFALKSSIFHFLISSTHSRTEYVTSSI